MNKFWKFFTREVIKLEPHTVPDYIVFSVENFNNWFNAKDNGATYANPGIFLRLDKLSISHVHDYMGNCYGIQYYSQKGEELLKSIREDWRRRLNEKHFQERIHKKTGGR